MDEPKTRIQELLYLATLVRRKNIPLNQGFANIKPYSLLFDDYQHFQVLFRTDELIKGQQALEDLLYFKQKTILL